VNGKFRRACDAADLGRVRGNVDGNLQPADDFPELDLRRSLAARSRPVNLAWSMPASEIEIPGYPAPVDPVSVKKRPVDRKWLGHEGITNPIGGTC
jgi:hypothetical protein